MSQQQQTWVSPTLPPQVIAQYQQTLPDAAERFFAHMEREQAHRHELQRSTVTQVSTAQRYTFTLAALALLGGFAAILLGQAAGLVAVLAGVLPFVQAVYERHKQDKLDREQRSQLGPGA